MKTSFTNQKGSALVIALLVVVLSGTIVQLGYQTVNQSTVQNVSSRLLSTRTSLSDQLIRYSSMGATYRSSIDPSLPSGTNASLANCIIGSVPASCEGGVTNPVSVYDPLLVTSTGSTPRVVSGATTPAYYDLYGNSCTPNTNPNCVIQVLSTFTPTCAGGASSCTRAQSITLNFSIKGPSNYAQFSGPANSVVVTTAASGVAMNVSSILPTQSGGVSNDVTIETVSTTTNAAILAGLQSVGITNPNQIAAINSAILATGITDPGVLQALGSAGLMNTATAAAIGNALLSVGSFTSQAIENTIAQAGIASPVIASALNFASVGTYITSGTDSAIASAITAANITNQTVANAVAMANITDPTVASNIAATITGAGITDQLSAYAVAANNITNVAVANDLATAILNSGLTTYETVDVPNSFFAGRYIVAPLSQYVDLTNVPLTTSILQALADSYISDTRVVAIVESQHITTAAGALAAATQFYNPQSSSSSTVSSSSGSAASSSTGGTTTTTASSAVSTTTTAVAETAPVDVNLVNTCQGNQCTTTNF